MIDNDGIRERVKQVKGDHKITNLQLSKQCGVTIQTIITQVYGKRGTNISLGTIVGLIELVPSTDIRWLLTGEHSISGTLTEVEKNVESILEMVGDLWQQSGTSEKF